MSKEQPQYEDDYNDYEINTLSDLFKLIELRLREARRTPSVESALSRENLLRHTYEEALGWARRLQKANPKLIEPPDPTPNNEKNLIALREWCTDPRRQKLPSKKQKIAQRNGEVAYILEETPDIKLAELANRLGVSKSTISRNKVWELHRKKPPRERFRSVVDSPHQTKPNP